jgi:hypothetical protein
MAREASEKRLQKNQEELERIEKQVKVSDRQATIRLVLILCGILPFLFFLNSNWAHAALLGYMLTACFFGLLLVPEYPPVGTSWFWRSMIPVFILHVAAIVGLVWLNLSIPEMNRMPRMLYGYAGIVLVIEWQLAKRIVDACQPK